MGILLIKHKGSVLETLRGVAGMLALSARQMNTSSDFLAGKACPQKLHVKFRRKPTVLVVYFNTTTVKESLKMRNRRTFTVEFKAQMVKLYENGKPRKDIIREYDLTPSALDKWIKQSKTSGSFKEKDNRSPEENELIQLRKENKRLLMENDILKQAALILGQK